MTLTQIQSDILRAEAELARTRSWLAGSPGSKVALLAAESMEAHVARLRAEFAVEAESIGLEVCRYRIFGERQLAIAANAVGGVLKSFQDLLTLLVDVAANGPKARAKVAPQIQASSRLNFGYAFQGSVGFVLTVPNEADLTGDGPLDAAISLVHELSRLRTADEFQEAGRRHGVAVVRALHRWAREHATGDVGADIQWSSPRHRGTHVVLQQPEMRSIEETIMSASEKVEDRILVRGELTAVDLDQRSVTLKTATHGAMSGKLSPSASFPDVMTLPKRYAAEVVVTSQTLFAEERETKEHLFLSLNPVVDSGSDVDAK